MFSFPRKKEVLLIRFDDQLKRQLSRGYKSARRNYLYFDSAWLDGYVRRQNIAWMILMFINQWYLSHEWCPPWFVFYGCHKYARSSQIHIASQAGNGLSQGPQDCGYGTGRPAKFISLSPLLILVQVRKKSMFFCYFFGLTNVVEFFRVTVLPPMLILPPCKRMESIGSTPLRMFPEQA